MEFEAERVDDKKPLIVEDGTFALVKVLEKLTEAIERLRRAQK